MATMVAMAGYLSSVGLPSTSAGRRLGLLLSSSPAPFAQNAIAKPYLQAGALLSKVSTTRVFQQALSDAASLPQTDVEVTESNEEESLPTPIVIIDQESDPDATIVELSFGNRLGALLDTMQALKELGLNVERSRITVDGPITRKRFAITRVDNGRKIEDPELLEAIRLTIITNMIEYHPVC